MEIDMRLLVLIGVPALVIGGLFVWQYSTVVTGEEVEIEVVEPVDPWDVFRGQYAVLDYSINTLDAETVGYEVEEGDTVYVVLERNGEYWEAVGVSEDRPETDGRKCIRGEVESVAGDSVRVTYGIEEFFASPDEARRVEDERLRENVSGIVSLDARCNSVLRGVRIGNETIRSD